MSTEPSPTNPIIWVIVGIALVIYAMAATPGSAPASVSTPVEPPVLMAHPPIHVDSVKVDRHPSFAAYPAPLFITVQGSYPTCGTSPVQVTQRREGNEVYVTIFRDIPTNVACAGQPVDYNAQIDLEGGFDPGTYTIHVNDFSVTYTP